VSHAGVEMISAFLAESGMTTGTVAERRAALEQMAAGSPPPEGVTVENRRTRWPSGRADHPRWCGVQLGRALPAWGWLLQRIARQPPTAASRIALASRCPVALLDYRLAPEDPFPAAVTDATSAYRDLISSGITPDRVAIAGDSAGAD